MKTLLKINAADILNKFDSSKFLLGTILPSFFHRRPEKDVKSCDIKIYWKTKEQISQNSSEFPTQLILCFSDIYDDPPFEMSRRFPLERVL